MDIKEMKVGDVLLIAEALGGKKREGQNIQLAPNGSHVIAVLQRGWICEGIYNQDGDVSRLEKCSVIRRWGTTLGLGELAEKGPLSDTVRDPCPPVSFRSREAVMVMECSDAWGK